MTDRIVVVALDLAPLWASVDAARRAVQEVANVDRALLDRIALAASELVENAVKYGEWTRGGTLHLAIVRDGADVEIQVTQPVSRGSARARELLAIVSELHDAESAERSYRSRIRELVADGSAGGSRMGLRRIAHELGAGVAAHVDDTGVTVAARLKER